MKNLISLAHVAAGVVLWKLGVPDAFYGLLVLSFIYCWQNDD